MKKCFFEHPSQALEILEDTEEVSHHASSGFLFFFL